MTEKQGPRNVDELRIGKWNLDKIEHPLPDEFTDQYWELLEDTEIPGLALEYVDTLLMSFAEAGEFPDSVKKNLLEAMRELSEVLNETPAEDER